MFKVYAERCDQCLFSPNKIVSNARRAEILRDCKRKDSHFICHKATIAGEDVCCRGFYETQTCNLIRVMGRIGGIEFVALPQSEIGKAMTMEYVRVTYGVPAKRGGRVVYSGSGTRRMGTIKSADGGYLNVLLDGDKYPARMHPTWKVEYCDQGKRDDANG